MRLKTMFWAKGQRVISDAYREGYDRVFGEKLMWWHKNDSSGNTENDSRGKKVPASGRRR